MSISFPTFIDKEIPSPEKFNAFVQSLEAKFNAGFTSAEIQWPLVASGNLVMGTHEITGARKIFKLVNANEYSTLQAAVTAAGDGGVVFIPPDTAIPTGGVTLVGSNVAIVGAGPSSVIKYTASPTGPMIQNDSGGESGFFIANLTLDGNSEAGTEKDGLYFKDATDIIIHSVWFKDLSGDAIHLTNNGVAGNSCERVLISNCHFTAGGEKHIFADDLLDAIVTNCIFNDADEEALYFAPASSSAYMARILIAHNIAQNGDTTSFYITGSGAAGTQAWIISIIDNIIEGQDADAAIVAGTTGNVLRGVTISGNNVDSTHGGAGITCVIEHGAIHDNLLYDMAADGISLGASKYLQVYDNNCRSANNVGVRASNAASCLIYGNVLLDCNTAMTYGATVRKWNNEGELYNSANQGVYFATGAAINSTAGFVTAYSWTIPANALNVGDLIEVEFGVTKNGANNIGTYRIATDSGTVLGVASTGGDNSRHILCTRMLVTSDSTAHNWSFGNSSDQLVAHVNYGLTINFDRTTDTNLVAETTNVNAADSMNPVFVSCRVIGNYGPTASAVF